MYCLTEFSDLTREAIAADDCKLVLALKTTGRRVKSMIKPAKKSSLRSLDRDNSSLDYCFCELTVRKCEQVIDADGVYTDIIPS